MNTDSYMELYHKAILFSMIFDYDLIAEGGHFNFYNSPTSRSFAFSVDPSTYNDVPQDTIFHAFMERFL